MTTSPQEGTTRAPDGTQVAFTVEGSGPALVLTNGLTTTSFFYKHLRPRWREHHTVITWDLPGHGRSEPARSSASSTIDGLPAVLARVMDAVGVERAVQVGFSVGCQIVLEVAHQLPQRCLALVALFGAYRHVLSSTALPIPGSVIHAAISGERGEALASLMQRLRALAYVPWNLSLQRKLGVVGDLSREDFDQLLDDVGRVDTTTVARLACSAEAHTVEPALASLRIPLLILTGERDRFAPPDTVGEPLHRAVPGSVLVRVPGVTHTAMLEEPERIADEVERFLSSLSARETDLAS